MPRTYQDLQFNTRFQCSDACNAGVLLRMQELANGAYEGIFVALTDSLGIFRISLDENGRETNRAQLRAARSQIRIAPDMEEGGSQPACSISLTGESWNELHVALDANIIIAMAP